IRNRVIIHQRGEKESLTVVWQSTAWTAMAFLSSEPAAQARVTLVCAAGSEELTSFARGLGGERGLGGVRTRLAGLQPASTDGEEALRRLLRIGRDEELEAKCIRLVEARADDHVIVQPQDDLPAQGDEALCRTLALDREGDFRVEAFPLLLVVELNL